MATASDIIEGALRKLKVISAEIPVEDVYINNGLADLNDFGNELESTLALGFSNIGLKTDTVSIPDEVIGMFKSNLAIHLSSQYRAPSMELVIEAKRTMATALATFGRQLMTPEYPSSLPRGSGNQNKQVNQYQRFFPKNKVQNF